MTSNGDEPSPEAAQLARAKAEYEKAIETTRRARIAWMASRSENILRRRAALDEAEHRETALLARLREAERLAETAQKRRHEGETATD